VTAKTRSKPRSYSNCLLGDATVRGLLPKVIYEFDPEIEAEFPTNMSDKLTMAARGQSFT